MKDNIMVSVALYAYNEEKYIRQAIESIINQKTNFKYEIIVHDDASTDRTAEILQEYEKTYPNLIVGIYQHDNQYQKGVYIPQKYVYPIVRGKYMAYCDGDDYWTDPYKLQKQVDFLESHPDYSICTHAMERLYVKEGKSIETRVAQESMELDRKHMINWDGSKIPQIGTWVYRTEYGVNRAELFRVIQVGNRMSISDQPLGMYLSLQGKIWYIDEVMSVWRRYDTSVSAGMLANHSIAFINSKIEFLSNVKVFYPDEEQIAFDEELDMQELLLHINKEEYKKALKHKAFRRITSTQRVKVLLGCVSPKLVNYIREEVKHGAGNRGNK